MKYRGKLYIFCAEKGFLSLEINRLGKTVLQTDGFCCIFQYVMKGLLVYTSTVMRKRECMSEKKVIVSNMERKHDNPIAELVQVACQFDSEIILESEDKRINAKSIMGIMAFNPSKGMSVNIVADGKDEKEAIQAMEQFLVCR